MSAYLLFILAVLLPELWLFFKLKKPFKSKTHLSPSGIWLAIVTALFIQLFLNILFSHQLNISGPGSEYIAYALLFFLPIYWIINIGLGLIILHSVYHVMSIDVLKKSRVTVIPSLFFALIVYVSTQVNFSGEYSKISFYGQIVDLDGKPLSGITLRTQYLYDKGLIKRRNRTFKSGANGLFHMEGYGDGFHMNVHRDKYWGKIVFWDAEKNDYEGAYIPKLEKCAEENLSPLKKTPFGYFFAIDTNNTSRSKPMILRVCKE